VQDPDNAGQVSAGRPDDVDAGVGIVDPVHGHLMDAQADPVGEVQQLGVEEPAVVLHEREHAIGDVRADGLEATLRVGQRGTQCAAEQQVVAAGDELPLGAADDPGRRAEPAADGQVGVPADQGRHKGQQGGQISGQVDVHVGQHSGIRPQPGPAQRPSPPRLRQHQQLDAGQLGSDPAAHVERAVGAGVLGDRDPERVGKRSGQVAVQAAQARVQAGLLVVHRHHHVEDGSSGELSLRGGVPDGLCPSALIRRLSHPSPLASSRDESRIASEGAWVVGASGQPCLGPTGVAPYLPAGTPRHPRLRAGCPSRTAGTESAVGTYRAGGGLAWLAVSPGSKDRTFMLVGCPKWC
jgi:hypothetical protein